MIIQNFAPFRGQHCETTATGSLLLQIGIDLSEPMLFGIGQGLGFIFWNMKTMDFPFLGGRIKPDLITQNITNNLNLELTVKETSSQQKAWTVVKEQLDNGKAVGLKLDCYYLEYFTRAFHFAAHYVALYGYDKNTAYLVDTIQQGSEVKTSLYSLALARAEKGPMSSKNLYYTIRKKGNKTDLKDAVLKAIRSNTEDYLNPPISNIGYRGILKTSKEIIKWFQQSKNISDEFSIVAMLMEKAGTGGALFRNLYRDFLKESYDLLGLDQLNSGHEAFKEIAGLWNSVSDLFEKTSKTKNIAHIHEASEVLREISAKEKLAMEILDTL